ncbi:peptidoglycan-binding protein [Calothrix sp. NIES-3974]|uniref:peptidoglycan-binding protein n=1 Tax=Calothrix sp. NIES-3974 TaxID=2005462 RepID=UPI000B5F3F50|nr:peptidoglycan-binding protein [Calothrix sp. NIES-3974]BAZ04241.1 putative N-acetylmuramoyl-L-alanine amidase [Calothrix sp. NIES-3974]
MENTGFINLASGSDFSKSWVADSQSHPHHTCSWWKWSWFGIRKFLPILLTLAIVGIAEQTLAAKVGDRGASVTNIQRCLRQLGIYNGPITGYFGSQTETAVRQFQSRNGISAIGVVGPQTSRALQSRCQAAARPPASPSNPGGLRVGSRGDAVLRLQQNLRQLGFYTGPITGNFGTQTQQAVIRFQRAYGITPNGVAGPQTLATINRLILAERPVPIPQPQPNPPDFGGPYETLRPGDRNPFVTRLQENLRTLGYFNQNPTGFYGDVTRDAVARFQSDRGLPLTGVADRNTLIAIEEAIRNGGVSPRPECSPNGGNVCLGERSQRVALIQQRLLQWGFFRGNVDGFYDQSTRDAIVQFQRYSGLAATGIVDYQTWQALGLDNSNPIGNVPKNNYVVAIPIRANDTLERVRQFVPQAQLDKSRRGDFVNAGAFSNRSDAERLTRQLRDRGFDARVEYIN